MTGNRIIKLEPAWRSRNAPYCEVYTQHSPAGFVFAYDSSIQQGAWDRLSRTPVSFAIQTLLAEFLPIQLLKSEFESVIVRKPWQSLTYAIDHIVVRNEPWVLEMTFELPYILSGSERTLSVFRTKISRILQSENCRGIVCQLATGKKALLKEIGDGLDDKTVVIPRAFPLARGSHSACRERADKDDCLRLLFVNSGNVDTPSSFYIKGGHYVVDAFLRLHETFPDLELILRSHIPTAYRRKIDGVQGITVIDHPIPRGEMEDLWASASILVHPHFGNLSNVLLEAMGHGMPIVTTDTWATDELVQDGIEGYLVHNQLAQDFTEGPVFHFTNRNYLRMLRDIDKELLDKLVDRISLLIQGPDLRLRMGGNGYQRILAGKNSIPQRNLMLTKVLMQALRA